MNRHNEIESLTTLFLSLPLLGLAQFLAGVLIGVKASLALGTVGLPLWLAGLVFALAKMRPWKDLPRWSMPVFLLLAAWIFWLGAMPPYYRDDLIVHLEIPKYILSKGEWSTPPFQEGGGRPNLLIPINMVLVHYGLDRAASFIPSLFLIGAAMLLFYWVREDAGAGWAAGASISLLTLPLFFRLFTTAYTDFAVMFFSCAGLYYMRRYIETDDIRGGMKGAFSMAAGSAIKYNAGLLLASALVYLLILGLRRKGMKPFLKMLGAAVLGVALFCGPWWAHSAITGEKGYKNEYVAFEGPIQERMEICGESLPWALMAPVRLFFSGEEGVNCKFDGSLNPFILIFAAISFAIYQFPGNRFLVDAPLLYMVLATLLFTLTARYFMPLVPPFIYLSFIFFHLTARERGKAIPLAMAAMLLAVNIAGTAKAADGFIGWRYLTGRESREELLRRWLPSHGAVSYANSNLAKSDMIYFAFMGNQVYYCDIPYLYDAYWSGTTLMDVVSKAGNAADIKESFRLMGITHIMLHKILMRKFLNQNELSLIFREFQKKHATTIYEDRLVILLSLKG